MLIQSSKLMHTALRQQLGAKELGQGIVPQKSETSRIPQKQGEEPQEKDGSLPAISLQPRPLETPARLGHTVSRFLERVGQSTAEGESPGGEQEATLRSSLATHSYTAATARAGPKLADAGFSRKQRMPRVPALVQKQKAFQRQRNASSPFLTDRG